jgi:inorganic pyrophosphatase
MKNDDANTNRFFESLEKVIRENGVTIDRPKGSAHPRFLDLIYPIDYGYVNETRSQDGQGIDIFSGDGESLGIVGIICSFDGMKKDSEVKILYNCTEENIQTAIKMMNNRLMCGIFVRREKQKSQNLQSNGNRA